MRSTPLTREQEDRSDQDLARYIGESAEPLAHASLISKKTDDHASLGDEDTEQNRPKAGASANARIVDGYIHFWESTKIRLKPGILAVSPCHTPRKGDATWCCSPSRAWARVRRGSEGGIFS